MKKNMFSRIIATLVYGVLAGIGVNFFLTPAKVYSGGVTGLSQLFSSIGKDFMGINIGISTWVLIINLPLIYLSWKKLGSKFTFYSLLAVISSSFFISVIPVRAVTENVMLAAIFGGILTGAGVGICFRTGFSTGGTDIIIMVVQKMTGKSVGQLGFLLNGFIIALAGLMYGWEMALYSLISIYATTKIMDVFYIQQYKLTVNIITKKKDEVVNALLKNNLRGLTVYTGLRGGYTNEEVESIVTVISKPELLYVKKIVSEVDEEAFINVQPTVEVVGNFLDRSLI
ncbi:MAG: YitT family protein [Clostridium chrysemydis]|uniref:YitT family protein n=1 Tax=Clostridium TaxID=1485 RepID=UPI002152C830|nr:YitT family protein [Clostridium sp. LY3-2]MCR6515146.1 YitT family protein [Clostridium sp. LY3-2]